MIEYYRFLKCGMWDWVERLFCFVAVDFYLYIWVVETNKTRYYNAAQRRTSHFC